MVCRPGIAYTLETYWQNDTNGDGIADQNDAKEPIKWRVLQVDGDDVFLMSDKNLIVKNTIIKKLMLHGKLVVCELGYTVIFTERHFQQQSKMR